MNTENKEEYTPDVSKLDKKYIANCIAVKKDYINDLIKVERNFMEICNIAIAKFPDDENFVQQINLEKIKWHTSTRREIELAESRIRHLAKS